MANFETKGASLKSLLSSSEWWVEENSFDVHKINFYETIFTVGNGYLGTRGALEEGHRAALPSTYINGLFDKFDSTVVDLVNAPNWLPISIWVDGDKLSLQTSKVLTYERILDFRKGLLYRATKFQDGNGRITNYESLRYASFSEQHLCEIKIKLTPENYSGQIRIESAIDGNVFNLDRLPAYTGSPEFEPEVKWEKWAKSKHLYNYKSSASEAGLYLESKTLDRPHTIGFASTLMVSSDSSKWHRSQAYDQVTESVHLDVAEGQSIEANKLVSIFTTRDVDQEKIESSCLSILKENADRTFEVRLDTHCRAWEKKWEDCDCVIDGDDKANHALRFNIYHLLIAANPSDFKANVGAKSLSGEGYKGHVFWDTEIFMLPFYIYTQPETAKALLMYRYNTLEGAKQNAQLDQFEGARYPWESADTGLEETPKWTADGKERIWTGEEEIHITADVVFALLTYHTATGDTDFFLDYSAEILFETARFWASRLEFNEEKDYYELTKVIGPDEFHEHVDNSVFTNWLAKWNLEKSVQCYNRLEKEHPDTLDKLQEKITLSKAEVDSWKQLAEKVFIPFTPENKMIEEFEGYFQRKEVPITQWDQNNMPIYPEGLDHFKCNDTTIIKQPDVVMLLYILPDEFTDEIKKANYEYYEARTMHKSSLSPSIHTIMGIETGNTEKALQYFERAALTDLVDNQGNTEHGMHIASSGGTWQAVVNGFGGLRVKNQQLNFKPWLPEKWNGVRFNIKWHGDDLFVSIGQKEFTFLWASNKTSYMRIVVNGEEVELNANVELKVSSSK